MQDGKTVLERLYFLCGGSCFGDQRVEAQSKSTLRTPCNDRKGQSCFYDYSFVLACGPPYFRSARERRKSSALFHGLILRYKS